MELLPLSYPFRITYAAATLQKSQNVAADSCVQFQTANTVVELRDSNNSLLGEANPVQYYSGGWRTFGAGATTGGQVSMELLPLRLSIPSDVCVFIPAEEPEHCFRDNRCIPDRGCGGRTAG